MLWRLGKFRGHKVSYTILLRFLFAFLVCAGDILFGTLPVYPGQTLQVNIGGRGWGGGGVDAPFQPYQGGWNGGGAGWPGWAGNGQGGGGASDLRMCDYPFDTPDGCTLDDRVLVAAGAGGAYVPGWGCWGGPGGGEFNSN